jgi:CheY-like chemotaxis protein
MLDCQGARVLLAEDNPVNQMVARTMLERAGCHVTVVPNGRVAVEEWLTNRFALVLMDCQMPELDGFEATHAIRERERDGKARVPIVALTANAMVGDRARCLDAGMDDYLSKPFKFGDLAAVLRRWIFTPSHARAASA